MKRKKIEAWANVHFTGGGAPTVVLFDREEDCGGDTHLCRPQCRHGVRLVEEDTMAAHYKQVALAAEALDDIDGPVENQMFPEHTRLSRAVAALKKARKGQ